MRTKLANKIAIAVLSVTTSFSAAASAISFAEQSQIQQEEAMLTILPIDRATILAGQKFDFRVELNGSKANKEDIKVTINGVDAEKYFGKPAVKSNTVETSAEFTIRGVSFNKPEAIKVKAQVNVGGKLVSKEVNYEVYAAYGNGKNAKNVVLMIGDGMSANIRTAARVVSKGIEEGKFKGWLEMEKMDYMGMVTTSGMDSIVTDSANSASAYATGHKTAVSAEGVYPDNTTDPLDDPRVENIIELVKRTKGMSTGVVTTADVTDATPAAMATHTRNRGTSEAIVNMYFEQGSRPDVIMGGGSQWFLPEAQGGKRKDGKNMVDVFKDAGYSYAANATELNKISNSDKVLGLFKKSTMDVYYDREYRPNPDVLGKDTDQPTLMEMTKLAIDTLDNNKNGFFLMVEAASIDKQAHPMDMERLIWDTIEFDKTIGLAKEYAKQHPETLVIVTSDHGHSMTLNGTYDTSAAAGKTGDELREFVGTYENSKFPTYVDNDGDGFPDNPDSDWKLSVGWGNHPDYNDDFLSNEKPLSPTIQDPNVKDQTWYIANPDRDPNGAHFNGNLPHDESTEVHTFDDVPINAMGPGSELFAGYMDNTEVFRKMVTALGVNAASAAKGISIKVNGEYKQLKAAPIIKTNRAYIQVRDMVETLEGKLELQGDKVIIVKGSDKVELQFNSKTAVVNGKKVVLDAPVFVQNGRTYVPVRFVTEALGYEVVITE